jgi:CDP-glycerol glycerophosphotransferase (TagB/SpsB family)
MAKFTFVSGNVRALRRLPLYLLGSLVTYFVPRTERIWVFGSGIGPGEGALPLYRYARERLDDDVRLVWLATTDDELRAARELALDAVRKHSARGWWLTMRARVQVVTHGQGDVNRYGARGGYLVQLWHGIPLKRLHLDSPAALAAPSRLARLVVQRGYRAVGRQISLFPVSSERVVSRIASAFGVDPARVLVSGDPRDDVLLHGEPAARRATARSALVGTVGELNDGPVVMYAPTWREGEPDPAQPDDAAWRDIVAWLDRVDGTLLIRAHPLGVGDYASGARLSTRIRQLDASLWKDVNSALPAVDHLITDYSSMAYDFALTGGTIVFLAADVTTYLETRGLYEPYHEFTGGRHVATWQHALLLLDALVRPDPELSAAAQAHTRWLRDEHFDHLDGRATERVFEHIVRRSAVVPPVAHERAVISDVRVEPDRLVLMFDRAITEAVLVGPRARVTGTNTAPAVVEFALLTSRWGDDGLALPSGNYRLVVDGPTSRVGVRAADLPDVVHEMFRGSALALDGGFVLRIEAPLTDGERGSRAQRALRLGYLGPSSRENAVFFESFYGRAVSDNPRAVAAVLAREHPDVRQYWSVADRSVAVPLGATPVVQGSREWWRARAAVRLLVVNDWLRHAYRTHRAQHVLQTWHGTPLKRLARDRDVGSRTRLAALREGRRWDALLAQNAYSTERFRSAYAYRGPIWETGYPRNDVLADIGRAADIRDRVGIAGGDRVVLYAPTWRDNRNDLVDAIDLVGFAAQLPENHVLLVRAHSRVLESGRDLAATRLVDVTTYPDVAELMLVADVLVTDYSSVMFDFVVTDRPMIFYTPDLGHYGDVLRGFYFDFVPEAPGPVVETSQDLLAAVVEAQTAPEKYAARRAAWRERFATHDDGHVAERVVRKLYDAGWLG